jgi:hypothetical protein
VLVNGEITLEPWLEVMVVRLLDEERHLLKLCLPLLLLEAAVVVFWKFRMDSVVEGRHSFQKKTRTWIMHHGSNTGDVDDGTRTTMMKRQKNPSFVCF